MKRLCLCLVLFLALLSLPVRGFAEAEDPVVVRVGEYTYTQSEVQGSLDSMLELTSLFSGDVQTTEEQRQRLQDTLDNYIGLGIIENKLAEAGKNTFTVEQQEAIDSAAREQYEQFWQAMLQRMQKSDAAVTDAQVTNALEELGYTQEAIKDELMLMARQERARQLFCDDVTLTQSMVDEYYESQFVAPDREAYRDDLERYESEILYGDNEAFYTPEGYRTIRQIVLAVPQEALDAVKTERARVSRATQVLASAFEKLSLTATKADSWNDSMAAAKADYDAALDVLTGAQRDYGEKLKAIALPMVQPTVDEINQRYRAGIDFKSLADKYSIDRTDKNLSGDGYPFHPDSSNWPEAFRDAASALEKPGDISRPVLTDQGIHIICYVGDVPAGEYVLTEEERQMLNASALSYYQGLELDALIEQWKSDYEIETHPELLTY